MERRVTACLMVVVALAFAGCGNGSRAATAKSLDEWIRAIRALVLKGERPNAFTIPKVPIFKMPSAADDIGREVDQAAGDFSRARDLSYTGTRDIFCTWFAWYMETGRTLPSEEDFPDLLLGYIYGKVPVPPSREAIDAANLLRDSIDRAQSADAQVRNAATAAACSIPQTP